MREIKFRAWDNNSKKWFTEWENPNRSEWTQDDGHVELSVTSSDESIIIEQYTGLNDKNGKEICEGDILKWVAHGCPAEEYEELYKTYQVTVEWGCGGFDFPYNSESEHCYEVIGNIHQSE